MNETVKNDLSLKTRLFRIFCDPVLLYTVLVMMSIMYHYRDTLVWQYGIAAFLTGAAIFRLFDFMMKHKFIGGAAYIVLFYMTLQAAGMCIDLGTRGYPIGFYLWFFTPQLAVDYNKWFTVAIFLLFMIFMSSVIYYFTRVRYRLFMNFLIFIIPFVIYGKEYEKMPTTYIILLAVGFIVLMFYCRQLTDSENVVIVEKRWMISSAAVFTVIFAVVSAIIPKPQVEADREGLESMISAERFTDRLVAALSGFRDTTSGSQFRQVDQRIPIYYATASEPLRLKLVTFSDYDFSTDSWSAAKADSSVEENYSDTPVEINDTGALTGALLTAAHLDSDFAEKYGISDLTDTELYTPETRRVILYSINRSSSSAPVPQFAQRLSSTSYDGSMDLMKTGLIFTKEGNFGSSDRFTFEYSADTFFSVTSNRDFIDALSVEDYDDLLSDARDVLEADGEDEAYETVSAEYDSYTEYVRRLTDYGESERIYELAQEITAGLDSDYDKAKALEMYLFNNGYIYDLDYVKSQGENVENFLFNTKRGVCYEYATSMVLLSRAAGIPARYCEGFNMQQEVESDNRNINYIVTTEDSHGFPELYIKGYGWVSFEPTITSGNVAEEQEDASGDLARAGIIILIGAVIVFLLIIFSPAITHRFFIMICRRKTPSAAAVLVMQRLRRLAGMEKSSTSGEVAAVLMERTGTDISETARLFDKAAYGGAELSDKDKEKSLDGYLRAYNALREEKRKKRRITNRKKATEDRNE